MSRVLGGASYLIWITWQVISLSAHLGRDVLTPGLAIAPRIVKHPVPGHTDLEVALLASSITITPGTLVVGIAPSVDGEPRALYVQALYGDDETAVAEGLAEMDRRLLRMTRGGGR